MTQKVCAGALLKCSCGLAPTALNVIPDKKVLSQAPTALEDNQPALTKDSKLMCAYGGIIEITMPEQMTTKTG